MLGVQPLLPEIISNHGRWRARKPALVVDGQTLSWGAFHARTNQVANGLIAAGLKTGDRLGVVMNNCAPMAELIVGAMKSGVVVTPLNVSVPDEAIDAMLKDASVSAVAASASHIGRISRDVQSGARLLIVEGDCPEPSWRDYVVWRDGQSDDEVHVSLRREDLCNIIYSSGTTSLPKGIMHSHGGRLDWAHDLGHALRYHENARLLVATGLYSNITWAGMLPTLLLGGTIVVRPGFSPQDILETIDRERITHTSMVPVQFQRLLEYATFDEFDVSSMHAMMCCGSPLPERVKRALFDKFDCGVIELYGSTEGVVTTLSPEDAHTRMTSVGKPVPGEDIAIISDDGRYCAVGEAGEIVARSRFAMDGYWNNPRATEEAQWVDGLGGRWLRSGDIGRLDEDGFLYITDRKKDMIISGGQNIYPADLEAVLMQHDHVADCAVFGVPSERWGETPLALLVLRESSTVSGNEILLWANEKLGKQQRIALVEVRASLPRNANGKLLKRELRAPYWEQAN